MKKLMAMLTTLCLAAYLTGCGEGDTPEPSGNGMSTNGNGANLDSGTETPTDETDTQTDETGTPSDETDTPADDTDTPTDEPAPPDKPEGGNADNTTDAGNAAGTNNKVIDDTKDDIDEEN